MKKTILIVGLISIMYKCNANAGSICQTITPKADIDKYSFELISEDNDSIVLVKFTIPEDCYVNIKVTDKEGNTIQELVQDEMYTGTYNVYNRSSGKIFNGTDKCIMEIRKKRDDTEELIFIQDITLSVK